MLATSSNELASLTARGESTSIDFKERPDISRASLAPHLIAFANSGGGIILFGVRDTRQIVGVGDKKEETAVSRLSRIAASVLGRNGFKIGVAPVEGKRVIFLEVFPGILPSLLLVGIVRKLLVRQWPKARPSTLVHRGKLWCRPTLRLQVICHPNISLVLRASPEAWLPKT